ncbi:MAG TPA: hypothetical protein VFA06_22580 [Actinocrinis sp.]|uniref:hypothetical protein n=1 Tax=Actinocrinis sp. TaxID=1920516 RepID=UPI002D3B9ACC|nr:hypothetical protein [Actinocrinis sp.]HZU58682.1 hypothetical protein [Actinocrinis sp.]
MSDGARLRWRPELGGKISSLRFGAAGREWLAAPVRPLTAPDPGQDWAELDCSGWDECFPNLGAALDRGLQDHGDVWRLPWLTQAPDSLAGAVEPEGRGYRFEREITATGGPHQNSALRIVYRLENLGDEFLAWTWAQHMLLAAHERMRIVSSSPMRLRIDSAYRGGEPDDSAFDDLIGTAGAEPVAEISLGDTAGRAAKLWLEPPLPEVVAVVDDGAGEWLAWKVADSTCPHLGLWVNLGGWGDPPLRHVAIEPAFGVHDDPADAYAELEPLAPGARTAWRVIIQAGIGQEYELFMNKS